jgi:hypothetical protein
MGGEVMEDLGRIVIDIREGQGGTGGGAGGGGGGAVPAPTGGGGAAGGGPSAAPKPAEPPPIPPTLWQRVLTGMKVGSEVRGEVSSFLRAPSMGGLSAMFGEGGAVGGVLGKLGAVGAAAAPVLAGVVVIAAGVAAALRGMKAAAEIVTERMRELSRYSGAMMMAQAQERMRELQRAMADAAANGRLYAAAQREATAAGDAQAKFMLEFNKIIAAAAIAWHRLMNALYSAMTPTLRALNRFSAFLSQFVYRTDSEGNMARTALGIGMNAVTMPMWAQMFKLLWEIAKKLGLIEDNTRPKQVQNPNDWFRADVMAITGRRY